MQNKSTGKLTLIFLALTGITAFVLWLAYNPVKNLNLSLPGMDNRPKRSADKNDSVIIGEKYTFLKEINTALTGKWPHFRGMDYDNINKEKIKLIDHFEKSGPKIVWKADMGEGHAAAAIYNGKVYVLDYNEAKKADVLKCLSLETGENLWRRSYTVRIKRNHGISRTIPAVTEKYIVTLGPKGHVMCVSREKGDFLWGLDLEKEYGGEIPFWNTGQCPMIDNDVAIIATGGNALMIGVDCATGKVVWETPNSDKWKMSHSSIMPMLFEGKKMYVYSAIGGVCGISAEAKDAGRLLWKCSEFGPNVVAPSPVILNNGKIFITAGYGVGAMLFQVLKNNDAYSVKVLQKYLPTEGVASEQQTPVFYKGYMFAILPKDAGGLHNQFVCCNPADCKKIIWSSGNDVRFGLGPYIIADGKFFIVDDDGSLSIAEANTSKFVLLSKTKIMDGQDAWGPIAIADGKLIMRDSKEMICIDIKK
ncbi:MAG: PQQ-binding-like beta-propeller repeat protein [Bacteroidetes bacterium]|nr:PQQ-binding-like beta-propeller repeat protein [Bacteroidota bacterium]